MTQLFPKIFTKNNWIRILAISLGLFITACQSAEEQTVKYTERGKVLLAQNQPQRASAEFRNALHIDPEYAPAYKGLADSELKRGNIVPATRFYRAAVKYAPENHDYRLQLGRLLLVLGVNNEVADISEQLIEAVPDKIDVQALRAGFFLRVGQYSQAMEYADKVLTADPVHTEALVVKAASYVRQGAPDDAIAVLDAVLRDNPDAEQLHLVRVRILEQIGDPNLVLEAYQNLVTLRPRHVGYQRALAAQYTRMKKYIEARGVLDDLYAQAPDDPERQLDIVRFVDGAYGSEAALQEVRSQLVQTPGVMPLHFMMAKMLQDKGEVGKALSVLEMISTEAVAVEDRHRAFGLRAQIELERNNRDLAEEYIAQALKLDDRSEAGLLLRARLQIEDRELNDAIATLRVILIDHPDSAAAHSRLGRAYELDGAMAFADASYGEAVRASSFQPNYVLEYSRFLRFINREDRAEAILAQAIKRRGGNVPLLRALAALRLDQGNWSGAREVSEAIKLSSGHEEIARDIEVAALRGEGEIELSIEMMERTVVDTPDSVKPLVTLVRSYVDAGRVERATEVLESLLEAQPERADVMVLLADLKAVTNHAEQADEMYQQAITLAPDQFFPYAAAYRFLTTQRRMDDAISMLQTGREKVQLPQQIDLVLAEALQIEKDFDGAIAIYEDLLAKFPNVAVVANNLASLLTDHRDDEASHKRAVEIAERFRDSPSPAYRDTLGWALLHINEHTEALAVLRDVVEMAPDVAVFRFHLGEAYSRIGETTLANEELARARKLVTENSQALAQEIERSIERIQ